MFILNVKLLCWTCLSLILSPLSPSSVSNSFELKISISDVLILFCHRYDLFLLLLCWHNPNRFPLKHIQNIKKEWWREQRRRSIRPSSAQHRLHNNISVYHRRWWATLCMYMYNAHWYNVVRAGLYKSTREWLHIYSIMVFVWYRWQRQQCIINSNLWPLTRLLLLRTHIHTQTSLRFTIHTSWDTVYLTNLLYEMRNEKICFSSMTGRSRVSTRHNTLAARV